MRIVELYADDWVALYDEETGKKLTEGHTVNHTELLESLGHQIIRCEEAKYTVFTYESVWSEKDYNFPENLHDPV